MPPGHLRDNPGTDYLRTNKGPAYSFGLRHPPRPDAVPGPSDYDCFSGFPHTLHNPPTSRWGPPPRQIRAVSAPRTVPVLNRPPKDTRLPVTFKGPWQKMGDDGTPGPAAYAPTCGCKACDGYHGKTMGVKTEVSSMPMTDHGTCCPRCLLQVVAGACQHSIHRLPHPACRCSMARRCDTPRGLAPTTWTAPQSVQQPRS